MVLAISGGLFTQEDVRETPSTSVSVSGYASDGASYVTVNAEGGLTSERVLTGGDGITLTDGGAGSTITITNDHSGTSYWSTGASGFVQDKSEYTLRRSTGADTAPAFTGKPIYFIASVILPHGATITKAVTYGSDNSDTWTLYRRAINSSGAGTAMANGNFNTEDSTISNATIDNNNYVYYISTSELVDPATLYGARITYTR